MNILERLRPEPQPLDAEWSAATLQHIFASSEPAGASTRAKPRRRRAVVAGVGAVAVLAGGWGAAAAAGLTGGRDLPWTDPVGSRCSLNFGVNPVSNDPTSAFYPAEPDAVLKHIDPVAQQKAVADGRRFLASFDLNSVDQKKAVADYQAVQAENVARGLQADPATGDDLIAQSIRYLFGQELVSYLRSRGDNPILVVYGFSAGGDACFDHLPGEVARG